MLSQSIYIIRFDLAGDCQQTRVELCACTSDRELENDTVMGNAVIPR